MKKFLITGLATASLAAIGPAAAQTAPDQAPRTKVARAATPVTRAEVTQRVQQHFAKLDANRDGYVTKAEADAALPMIRERVQQRMESRGAAMFDRLDANNDGVVTRAEFDAGRAAMRQRMGVRQHSAGMRHAHFGGRMFEMADANKDGNVSLQEATNAALAHFDSADLNRDGTLTPDERRQARQRMRANAPRS